MFWFILGYLLAVLFPIYGLNAVIVSMWAKIGASLASYINAPTPASASISPTPVAPASPGLSVPVTVPPPSSQRVHPNDHTRAF